MTMKPFIIPIFITQAGCPQRCIFCNAGKISGEKRGTWTEDQFRAEVEKHIARPRRRRSPRQIAFYGGNFTGLEESVQLELLRFANHYIERGLIDSLRVSTRPDHIRERTLEILRAHRVTTVELGAQSMNDRVLEKSLRGHTARDVAEASATLQSAGFETGIHLMAGLPGDSPAGFRRTVEAVIGLRPDMVRIHPTLVFEDTGLAELYRAGRYIPLSLNEAVELCRDALVRFTKVGIPVIRLGLQTTAEMETAGSILAGPYHPAFRSLVEGELFREMAFNLASRAIEEKRAGTGPLAFSTSPGDVSSFLGLRRVNLEKLRTRYGREIAYGIDSLRPRGSLFLTCGRASFEQRIGDLSDGGARQE